MNDACVAKNSSGLAGIAGEQPDFLRECGVIALLNASVQHGRAGLHGVALRDCSPEPSQTPRESNLPEFSGQAALHSRSSADYGDEIVGPENKSNWAEDAHKVIDAIPDESFRPALIDRYEETAAFIEYEQNVPREQAEQQAFGLLLFHLIRHGIDVGVES
jgi:hypothetical protein